MGPEVKGTDRRGRSRPWALAAAAVLLVAIGLYARTLGFPLIWDDLELISFVESAARDGGVHSLLSAPFPLSPALGYYRPVVLVSLWLDGRLGTGAAWTYHLTNVALHGANSLLVLGLLAALGMGLGASFCGTLLFAAHPAHVESVAWVSGRTDLWAAFFSLGSAVLWALGSRDEVSRRALYRVLSGAAYGLAALSKEVALVLPGVLLAWDVLRGEDRRWAVREWWSRNRSWAVCWGSALILVLFLRQWAAVGFGRGVEAGPVVAAASLAERVALMPSLWATYFRLLVCPWPFNAYYVPATLDSPGFLVFWLALAGVAYRVLRPAGRSVLGRSLLWIAALLVPVSGLVPFRGAAAAERFLYLPSVGVSLAVGGAMGLVKARRRRWCYAAVFVVVAAWAALSMARCEVWRTPLSLARDLVRTAPMAAMSHYNLGNSLAELGHFEEAVAAYRQALALNPGHALAYNNLGLSYRALGRYPEAVWAFNEAVKVRPSFSVAFWNLSLAYRDLGYEEAARVAAEQAAILSRRP